jgi:hypothetical protein
MDQEIKHLRAASEAITALLAQAGSALGPVSLADTAGQKLEAEHLQHLMTLAFLRGMRYGQAQKTHELTRRETPLEQN